MFSGGTFARMLWTCWKTKPPPGERMRTWFLDVLGNLLGLCARENLPRVAAAAPERQVPAEFGFQLVPRSSPNT